MPSRASSVSTDDGSSSAETPSTTSAPTGSNFTATCQFDDNTSETFTSFQEAWSYFIRASSLSATSCDVVLTSDRKPLPGEREALAIARRINNGNSDADNLSVLLGICIEVPKPDEEVSAAPEFIAAAGKLCPKAPHAAILLGNVFYDGSHTVSATDPLGIKPGRYRGVAQAQDCYWERTTASGDTIANDFVTYAPTGVVVTIRASDRGFSSSNCGPWTRVS